MPASGIFFAQTVLAGMGVLLFLIWGIARYFGGRAPAVVPVVATALAWTLPFLFFWRTAVYGGMPANRDVSLGWPFIYTHAQSDSGLSSFRLELFFADFSLGILTGLIYFFLRRYYEGMRQV